MATGTFPAIDPVWAFDASMLTPAQRSARSEAILSLRVQGRHVEHIVARLGVTRKCVANVLAHSRKAGDLRALTNAQAEALTQAVAADREAQELRTVDPRGRTGDTPRDKALDLADFCRLQAAQFAGPPAVSSGFLHLADLLEHHGPQLYPELNIPTRPLAHVFVSRILNHSPVGSPAAACAAL